MTELKVTQADIDRADDFFGLEINDSWGLPSLRQAFAAHRVHTNSNPGTAHPPLPRGTYVPTIREWENRKKPSLIKRMLGW